MCSDSPSRTKSLSFAKRIVAAYRYLCEEKQEFVLPKQLLRSRTSIGANLAEAQYGSSRKDFLNKVYIALKECSETLYCLELLSPADISTKHSICPSTTIAKNFAKFLLPLPNPPATPNS